MQFLPIYQLVLVPEGVLETKNLLESNLFRLYNQYGKLEDDLDSNLQNPIDGESNDYRYDFRKFHYEIFS